MELIIAKIFLPNGDAMLLYMIVTIQHCSLFVLLFVVRL